MQRKVSLLIRSGLALACGICLGFGLSTARAGPHVGTEAMSAQGLTVTDGLHNTERSLVAMQQSLSLASSESEIFRRHVGELKLRMEAVGVQGIGSDVARLEQRLLKAVNDLQLLRSERLGLRKSLIQLVETVLRFQKSSVNSDVEARASLEAEMRLASRVLGVGEPNIGNLLHPRSLASGTIISLNEDLSLVVANIGASSGVRIGMPFRVMRGEQVIGTLQVVDVRETIAGALAQSVTSEGEGFEIGDRLRVDSHE